MKHKQALILGSTLLIIIILILWSKDIGQLTEKDQNTDVVSVDPELLSAAKVSESLDYLIFFEEQADLSGAYELPWNERGWYVYNALVSQAEESQAKVRKYLDRRGVSYQPFWIQNVIAVEDSGARTLNGLTKFMEIESLRTVPVITLENPLGQTNAESPEEITGATNNLLHINADDAWAAGMKGEGFVVGSIDTGVRYTHEALKNQYRGYSRLGFYSHSFQWWDAVNGSSTPYDDHGHGSHTTGIMVGADPSGNVIGVAPEAKWIACKAIDKSGSGLGWDFLECGQFMLAPWDIERESSNPNLRPHVINNSWGSCSQANSDWFEGTIDAWHAAGIYPVFANGNASNCGYDLPPGLGTVSSPARAYNVTAVGSTGTDDGVYAIHSNWGPTDEKDTLNGNGYPYLKPQVVAPGVSIRSAVSSGDSAYADWGGTSMSAPHVSGLVPLMWQAGSCLIGDYAQTENLIEKSAVPLPFETGNGDEGPGNIPNHATGWGEIDVQSAVQEASIFCSAGEEMMTLSGVVRDGSGHGYPLYARISLVSDHHNPTVYTDPFSGAFEVKVYKDAVYDLNINSEIEGYRPVNETKLIFTDKNATRDYLLKVTQECDAPGYYLPDYDKNIFRFYSEDGTCGLQKGGVLAGFVADAKTGLPVHEASISRDGYFVETRVTSSDPKIPDGLYWVFQPLNQKQESILILASSDYYRSQETTVLLTQDAITEKDFALRHYKDILKNFLSTQQVKISAFLAILWDKILNLMNIIWEAIIEFASRMWAHIAKFFIRIWVSIADFFVMLWENVTGWFVKTF